MAIDADRSPTGALSERGLAPPRARVGPLLLSLLVLAVVCVLLASAGSAWYVERGVSDALQTRSRVQQEDEVEMVARLLAARLEQQQKILLTLADSIPLDRLQDSEALARALHHELPLAEWFDSLSVALADGRLMAYVRAGKDRPPESLDGNERELLRRTLSGGKPMVGTVLLAGEDDLRLLYTAPLRSSAGDVVGVMAGGLRLSSQALLPPAPSSGWASSRLMLVAPDGSIVAHSDPARWLGHVRDEAGLGTRFAAALPQQLPVQIGSSTQTDGAYLLTVSGMPLPQWFLVRVTRLQSVPLWGMSGWGSQALLGSAVLALLACLAMVWLARPWRELAARAAHLLQRPGVGGMPRLAHLPAHLPALPHAWGEAAVLWRALHALSRQRDAQARRATNFQAQTVTILEEAPVAIVVTRRDRVELLGTQVARMLGYLPQELQGYPIRQLCASDADHRRLMERVHRDMRAYDQFDDDVCLMRKDGSPVWLRMQGRRIAALHPRDTGMAMVWMVKDVTDERHARAQPEWRATHDPLTQLPNREALIQRLQQWFDDRRRPPAVLDAAAAPARAPGDGGVLLFLDLDHFATVNDIAGHDAGDAMLRHFARLLEAQVQAPCWVARLGGDEFAVLLPEATPQSGRAQADQLCATISAWEASYQGQRFWLGVSIGMVVLDAQQASVAAVLHAADMACYEAKRQGRGRVHEHCRVVAQTEGAG